VRQPEDAGRSIQAAKNETALDHYQVRKHAAWHRHITLAPCAQAWLAVAAAAARPPPVPAPGGVPGDGGRARVGDPGLWTTIPARQSRCRSAWEVCAGPPAARRDKQ